jgi:hypothetical protein
LSNSVKLTNSQPSLAMKRNNNQPVWVFHSNVGTPEEPAFLYVDHTGHNEPELVVIREPIMPHGKYSVYTVSLARCTMLNNDLVTLSVNSLYASKPAWFAGLIPHAHEVACLLCSLNPIDRATGYLFLAELHGVAALAYKTEELYKSEIRRKYRAGFDKRSN